VLDKLLFQSKVSTQIGWRIQFCLALTASDAISDKSTRLIETKKTVGFAGKLDWEGAL
jgi:hypothetical protein